MIISVALGYGISLIGAVYAYIRATIGLGRPLSGRPWLTMSFLFVPGLNTYICFLLVKSFFIPLEKEPYHD